MDSAKRFQKFGRKDAFRTTFILRTILVFVIMLAVSHRDTIPIWMLYWFEILSYPFLVYNLIILLIYKKVLSFLEQKPLYIVFDLLLGAGLLWIGAGWRNSYFLYILTTIILFTIFYKKKGAYFSAIFYAVISLLRDPTGGDPSSDIFDVSSIDMRMGAAMFFIMAGLIFAYFQSLMEKLQNLSEQIVDESKQRAILKEKLKLSYDLHDSIKSKVKAIIFQLQPIVKEQGLKSKNKEILFLWKWLNYLQLEITDLVKNLKSEDSIESDTFDIIDFIKREINVLKDISDFHWYYTHGPAKIIAPLKIKHHLSNFLNESLTNACIHSQETKGSIELNRDDGMVSITISDNGIGFDESDTKKNETLGLKSMQERARELNGHLTVDSQTDNGCTLCLKFPVP